MPSVELRASALSGFIREHRMIAVLRRVEPASRLTALVRDLAEDGVRAFEITMDGIDAPAAIASCRQALPDAGAGRCIVGAGTVRTADQLSAAIAAGADFGVSPIFDRRILAAALESDLPFIPGAYTPTEVDAAWRDGATFVKLFPASSLGPTHIREMRGPLGEIELIPTGGLDATNVAGFLSAGAVAVGVGSALVSADGAGRRAVLDAVRQAP